MATTEDVVGAALFLASDLSSGITGHLIPVDAGSTS
jgi:enoyl-[acyl-carrier-protein] reductase (NADH)